MSIGGFSQCEKLSKCKVANEHRRVLAVRCLFLQISFLLILKFKFKTVRKFLFKGKRVDNKRWVEGYIVKSEKGNCYIFNHHFIPAKSVPSEKFIEVIPTTVCQFSGFYDIKHKMIFENDIIQDKEQFLSIVVYDNGFCAKFLGEELLEYDIDSLKSEIIGNSLDNSDIL